MTTPARSSRSTPPSRRGWVWACRSVRRSSRRMAAGYGRPGGRLTAPRSTSRCWRLRLLWMAEEPDTVLVVDDDASVRQALADLLESVGLRVQPFASTGEFLRTTRPETPCCLVLDVRLPGKSGLD